MGALSSSLPARAMPSRLCSSASGPSPAPAPEGRLPPTDSASCFRTYVPHYPVSHRQDGVEIVVLDLPRHFMRPLPANYPEFPDSSSRIEFALFEDVLQVLVDRPHVLLEQFRDQRLTQPKRFIGKPALNARSPVFCLIQDDLANWGYRAVWHRPLPFYRLRTFSSPYCWRMAARLVLATSSVKALSRKTTVVSPAGVSCLCHSTMPRANGSTSAEVICCNAGRC